MVAAGAQRDSDSAHPLFFFFVLLQIFKTACPAWLWLLQEISLNTLLRVFT